MALSDKNAYMQVIGSLMKTPALLSEGIANSLIEDDFDTRLLKSIFIAIRNLYTNGAKIVSVVDVDNYLRGYEPLGTYFKSDSGIQYIQDCEDIVQEENFEYYCNRVKKFSALRALTKIGYDVTHIYNDKTNDPAEERKMREVFDELTLNELFDLVTTRIAAIENKFTGYSSDLAGSAGDGIHELIETLKKTPEIGFPLQGDIFNTVVRGARLGKFYLRSGSTGVGKTRALAGDAAFLAYPWRYSLVTKKWEHLGGDGQKVLMITTELELEEIKTMLLANLSGINEEKILYGAYTKEEQERISRAAQVMVDYKDNLQLEQISDPSVARLKSTIRKHCNTNKVRYVFYDYIFTSPNLLNEFRDIKVREDVTLGLLSAALKDLATELNVFVMSATQLSGDYENVKTVKTQTLLRGAKSIADKVDVGAIVSTVAKEDLVMLDQVIKMAKCQPPTIVTDIYKLRRGRYKGVRIWSVMDLGTTRVIDLFVTNHYYEPIPVDVVRVMFDEESFPDSESGKEEMVKVPSMDVILSVDKETGEILSTEPSPPIKKKRFEGLI